MAKLYARIKDDPTGAGTNRPDMRGSLKIGGYSGNEAEERNREATMWVKNLLDDFKEKGETWVSLALWKRKDKETGEPYLSICLEDNSWKKNTEGSNSNSSGDDDPFAL